MTEDSAAAGQTFDLLVIGGGINGAGIARDAAGRGLSVCLCEQGDLAQHTSSASTKLIHGGLRYLEQFDFGLVRHALQEREILLQSAPHIVRPLQFILPHHRGLRPRWMIRLGLFLYDHLGPRQRLPASGAVDLRRHPAGTVLQSRYRRGFVYSDCRVQDARLVVLAAMDAQRRGARVLTRTRCTVLRRHGDHWTATLRDERSGQETALNAACVVNAAGPWVDQVRRLPGKGRGDAHIRFVKGSHIVVPRLFDHDDAYLFQIGDGRVLFAIPFERSFTLLGTTDVELQEIPPRVRITPAETDYICRAASEYFRRPVTPDQVVWSYSGIRPLYDDAARQASAVTRDYRLELDDAGPPMLSVYGGKITTHRRLAEQALQLLSRVMAVPGAPWTATSRLPGGDLPDADLPRFRQRCRERWPGLPGDLLGEYAENYGTCIDRLLQDCASVDDLGTPFGGGLYQRELEYLMDREYAVTAEDVVWRRSKRGLGMDREQIQRLDEWMEHRRAIRKTASRPTGR